MAKGLSKSTTRHTTQDNGIITKRTDMVGRIFRVDLFYFHSYCEIMNWSRVDIHFDIGVRNLWNGMYKGEHRDGKMHGKGVMKYGNGTSYEGDFVNDLFDGTGTFHK